MCPCHHGCVYVLSVFDDFLELYYLKMWKESLFPIRIAVLDNTKVTVLKKSW